MNECDMVVKLFPKHIKIEYRSLLEGALKKKLENLVKI
jgi:hypothetical protein